MAGEDLFIRLGLKGQQQVARGLREVKDDTKGVGDAAEAAGAKAKMMGAKFSQATDRAGLGIRHLLGAYAVIQGVRGLGGITTAGVKWGLSFNAQVESARLRFGLFTDDVQGLTRAVQGIDIKSAFNFGDLSDAAALLGNNGVKDIPNVLQAAANAAAASGRGVEALNSIVIALSQIQAKGRLSQEEINQLNEAGAPGAQRTIQRAFHLTGKELQNLGNNGIDATKAVQALTKEWTSGKMAKAAEEQTKTLGGEWMLLTGNMQKAAGAATAGLAKDLEKTVLPAANRASQQITAIFGKQGLSNEEKLRQARAVIKRELGPIADDLKTEIDKADIPGHLGDVVAAALPQMASAAGKIAPDVAKAFVEAWVHSGPWAQILSLLFIAKKGVDAGRWLGGGKGGKGGVAGAVTGKGQTPLNPLYVWVVGEGVASVLGGKKTGEAGRAAGLGSKLRDAVKTAGPVAATAATRAAPVAGAVGAALATDVLLAEGIRHFFPNAGHANMPTRGQGASSPSNPAGSIPPPGFGTGTPGALTVKMVVNDREVATATAAGNAKQRARN